MSRAVALAVLASTLLAAGAVIAGDPAAAERQYRIARRLAAERSPEAARALRQVLELDPTGPLADDALVEQALLGGLPRWPEELGSLDEPGARRALALLDRVAEEFAAGDRALEARYHRALVRLEPLPTYDDSVARLDLIAVATRPESNEWTRAARLAGAWLAECVGGVERARAAWARLFIDAPASPEAARAAVAFSRLAIRDGEPGEAARLLDAVVAGPDPPAPLHAAALRELAVLVALHRTAAAPPPRATAVRSSLGVRDPAALALGPEGLLLADLREGVVVSVPAGQGAIERWALPGVQIVTADPLGRVWAAGEEGVYRLRRGAAPQRVASTGSYAPPSGLAVEAGGRIWLLDRKGETLGAIAPGAGEPREVWRSDGSRLTALRWDGRRLVALDARARDVVVFGAGSMPRPLGLAGLQKPAALAADVAGRLAVIDARDGSILVVDVAGQLVFRFDCKAAGIARPVSLDFGLDGALAVLDEATGVWFRIR